MQHKQAEISRSGHPVKSETYPCVSVIIGIYNHERYIVECLDSILGTRYPNLELIIMNDCSRDNSHAVAQAWIQNHPDQRTTYVNHDQNRGLTKTLNEAIALASGEYICLIAADDVMLPSGIIERVQYLIARPDKLAVFADCEVIDLEGKLLHESGITGLYKHTGMRKELLVIDELMPYNIVFHWGVPGPVFMCRRETFSIVGTYDENLAAEDWDMYLRIASTGRLGFCDTYVAKYRIHQKNMITTMRGHLMKQSSIIAKKNSRLFSGLPKLYLQYLHLAIIQNNSQGIYKKFTTFIKIRTLLILTNNPYKIKRSYIVFRRNYRNSFLKNAKLLFSKRLDNRISS